MFKEGDIVFYSGAPNQHGSNQEYQLIDERLVAKAPKIFRQNKLLVFR